MEIEYTPEKLFKIKLVYTKWNKEYNFLVIKKSLDFYKKWWSEYDITIIEELEPIEMKGLSIEKTSEIYSNCYAQATYKVESSEPLDEFKLDVLRAHRLFMGGQEEGKLYKKEEVKGKFVYTLKSVCDSSD